MSQLHFAQELEHIKRAVAHRFEIERMLGHGGMGAVYLARDIQLDRPVALKVLPAELARQSEVRERFLRETRTAAAFSHPNIVPVFSIESHEDLLAYSMGFVEGETLAERVSRSGAFSVKEVIRIMQDIGYALAYAHGRGVVHRDIKPDNIMIERATGRALLMDFGISRLARSTSESVAAGSALTRVGEVVGTPQYMSPEQAAGDMLDGRSDVYSLGLTAWFALTGKCAMDAESTQKVLVKQLTETVPPVTSLRADVPMELAGVIETCTMKEPDSRFATAEALVEALDSSGLRIEEAPLPIRIFEQELSRVSQTVFFGLISLPVISFIQTLRGAGNLDVVLPMVLVLAVLWGRLTQTLQEARRLFRRGFTVQGVQNGFRLLRGERDAERAILRATPEVVGRRRRQILIFTAMLVTSVVLRQWVATSMRTEIRPGWYRVSDTGRLLLYLVYVMRGIGIVGLLRSPLRPALGELLFRWTWASWPGRLLMSAVSPGGQLLVTRNYAHDPATRDRAPLEGVSGTRTGARQTVLPLADTGQSAGNSRQESSIAVIEQRVASLEAWQRSVIESQRPH